MIVSSTRRVWLALLVASLAVASAACGNAERPDLGGEKVAGAAEVATTTTTAPSHSTTVATTPATSVDVFAEPDAPTPAFTVEKPGPGLQAPADPLAFVVQQERDDWLRVELPVQPNGSTGWIKADGLEMTTTNLHIEISLSWYRLKLFDGEDLLLDVPVAIGADESPTPQGTFFTTTLMQGYAQPSAYGIAAFGLSAFSEVLDSFGGGPPQVAIHGTYDDDAIGQKVSNGCIRVKNADIQQLVDLLSEHLGVRVTIAA